MRRAIESLVAAGLGALVTYTVLKKPRRRHRRHERFMTHTAGTTMGISHDLLQAAHLLLRHALEERRQPVYRTAHNHATSLAPTIVVTAATALDAWLSELIGYARHTTALPDEQVASVIDIGTVPEKYERSAELLFQKRIRPSTDLKLLSKLRNEIVHFLPYAQDISARTVPDWLQYLEQHDLLISTNGSADFHFSQKLSSYALAYWACETVLAAAEGFAAQAQSSNTLQHFVSAHNFRVTGGLHSPEELHHYDTQYGLTLTR